MVPHFGVIGLISRIRSDHPLKARKRLRLRLGLGLRIRIEMNRSTRKRRSLCWLASRPTSDSRPSFSPSPAGECFKVRDTEVVECAANIKDPKVQLVLIVTVPRNPIRQAGGLGFRNSKPLGDGCNQRMRKTPNDLPKHMHGREVRRDADYQSRNPGADRVSDDQAEPILPER